ncbi:MAG: hypothetical protein CM15mP123_09760 [Gammaproteobacteria bacterium]|nr:MAG: hypothetical protein CM15mP123_09760 [Gammaproteobacteria bacterium]
MQTKLTLGYLGFLPFAALTILPWILGESYEKISFQLLVVYGGIIISFLSGIIWGINTANQKNLTISIIFSLLGFGAILMAWINLIFAMSLLFFLFYLFYLFESKTNPQFSDSDYSKLRKILLQEYVDVICFQLLF